MPTLADGGYEGAGIGICVPVKNPPGNQQLDPDTRTRNSLLRGLRSQGERGFALLTQRWTALQRITASPRRTTEIVRAALVLTQFIFLACYFPFHPFGLRLAIRPRDISSDLCLLYGLYDNAPHGAPCSKSLSRAWREQGGNVQLWSRIWTRWRRVALGL